MPAMPPVEPAMPSPAPAPNAPAAPAADPSGQGQKDPAEALMMIQSAMTDIGKALAGSVPKEVQAHLENALSEYNAFLAGMGDSMGMKMPGAQAPKGPSQQEAMIAGSKGAIPADQAAMSGRKIAPMKA